MGSQLTVTVSGYNRPDYLGRTLAALARCDGVRDCRVAVLLDPCDESEASRLMAQGCGFEVVEFTRHVGCNLAIAGSLAYGFRSMDSQYHVHFEDDTVPTADALSWFRWAGVAYRDDPAVMNASGYQRLSNGQADQCGTRRWFTPWGWATWRDRWLGLDAGWSRTEDVSWDVVVNHVLRAGRYEAFPTVSRIQNIGAERGTHVPNAEWHKANHHVAETADDLGGKPVNEWRHVRKDEHADHA